MHAPAPFGGQIQPAAAHAHARLFPSNSQDQFRRWREPCFRSVPVRGWSPDQPPSRIYKWIFIRVADRFARAFHITAGIENQADIVLGHGSQQRIAVLVEPFIVIVCMCIKKHSKPSSNPAEMPAGVPKSVLIHVGCDVIRFLLERGAGIAHRNRQPSLTEHADVVHAVAKHHNILIRNG